MFVFGASFHCEWTRNKKLTSKIGTHFDADFQIRLRCQFLYCVSSALHLTDHTVTQYTHWLACHLWENEKMLVCTDQARKFIEQKLPMRVYWIWTTYDNDDIYDYYYLPPLLLILLQLLLLSPKQVAAGAVIW